MSNYFCPRCGKAIIDNQGYSPHTCTPKAEQVFPKT